MKTSEAVEGGVVNPPISVTHESSDRQPPNLMHIKAPPTRYHRRGPSHEATTCKTTISQIPKATKWKCISNYSLLYILSVYNLFCTQGQPCVQSNATPIYRVLTFFFTEHFRRHCYFHYSWLEFNVISSKFMQIELTFLFFPRPNHMHTLYMEPYVHIYIRLEYIFTVHRSGNLSSGSPNTRYSVIKTR